MRTVRLALALAAAIGDPVAARAATNGATASFEASVADAKAAMMGEPGKALGIARRAIRLAGGLPDERVRQLAAAQGRWLEGEALTRTNHPDLARPVIDDALKTVTRLEPRGKLNADLLMSAATIDWMTGSVREALAEFQNAYGIYETVNEPRSQAKALQYIGTIYFDARDYERMLRYYRQSAEVYSGDPVLTLTALNNQGDALKEMKRFSQAMALYRRALALARRQGSPLLEVRVFTNLASAEYQAGHYAAADLLANRGLARDAGQDTGWAPFLWGVKAQAALARGDVAAAKSFVDHTFAGEDLARTTIQFREFHETAFRLFQRLGDDRLALAHLAAFKRLDDEQRDVTASTNSALLAARFDFTNQELSITRLKTGQLQRDVALERSRARLHTVTLYGLAAALAAAVLIIVGTLFSLLSIRRSRDQVRAANDTLSVSNSALEKALKAKTEFLATTSHEIRTPLNGILGMTQVLLADRGIDRAVRERVEVVHGAGETMRALVDDILDVAKMETGEIALVVADVDLARVLRDTDRLWSGQAQAKGLSLALVIEPDVPQYVRTDETRLRQIVFNLMSNAIKFTDAGSVTLKASLAQAPEGEMLVLSVDDTGIGIAAERHEEIFEAFKQVDSGTDRRYGGTGLGLAICRNVATAMRGTIAVDSAEGVGATFVITLPLVRSDHARTSAPTPQTVASARPSSLAEARFLIVEANPLAQSILRAVMAPLAASLEIVGDGAAAVQALQGGGVDLVLAEAASLGDDRGEVLRRASAAGTPTLVMFKPDAELTAETLRALGATETVEKPIAAPALVPLLRRLCASDTALSIAV